MAIYNASLLISASNATYFTNVTGGIAAVAVRDLNDSWISSSALLTGSNTFVGDQIISGNVDINGTITASLQTGYLYVGDGSGRTQAVATSSIITNIATGSFATTGSNTFIGNQIISGNVLPQVDGQGDIGSDTFKWNKIVVNGELKGSSLNTSGRGAVGTLRVGDETFPLSFLSDREIVGDGSGANTHLYYGTSSSDVTALREIVYTQSGSNADFGNVSASFNTRIDNLSVVTGSFATTGSNTFIGNQTISGSLFVSGSEVLRGTLSASALRVENNTHLDGTLTVTNDTLINGDVTIQSATPNLKLRDTSGGGFSSGYDLRVDTGSFEIYDDTHNRDVLSDVFNPSTSKHTTSLTSEIIVISGSTSVTLIGNVSASIISASTINGLGDPLAFSTSVDSRLDSLEGASGSYATTGSNTFTGNQTISTTGNTQLNLIAQPGFQTNIDFQSENSNFRAYGDFRINNNGDAGGSGSIKMLTKNNFMEFASDQGFRYGVVNAGGNGIEGGFVTINVPSGSEQLQLTGSLDVSNTFTASLANGFTYVGNASGRTTLVATSSFGTSIDTGSFATTGSNTFNGDQSITGSVSVFLPKSSGKEFRVNWGNASSASMFTEESAGPNQTLNLNSASLYINRGGLFFSSGSFTSQVGDMQFNAFPSASFTIRTQYGGDAILRANTDYTDPNRPYAYFQASPNGQINIVANGDGIAITGSLGARIQGLQYPLTDGTAGQAITTDGAGTLTFTTITGSGGGSTDTGSLLRTASLADSNHATTYTKGDGSTFTLGGFAATGSNTFIASQTINSNNALTISSSAGFGYGIRLQGQQGISIEGSGGPRINFPNNTWLNGNENDDFQFTGDTTDPKTRGMAFFLYGSTARNMSFRNDSGPSAEIQFQTTGSGAPLTNLSLTQNTSTFRRVLRLTDWNNNGNISMVNVSGSLSLTPNSFNATTASLLHLSASNNNQLINLVFKNNNNTGTTIISGSNNIFTNPNTPTTNYIRYVGGSNNIYLNHTNGINSQITASATSVSGVRPLMNNNIFQGTADFVINQAVNAANTGTTISNNLFGAANAMTINALAFTGSTFTINDNLFKGGLTTINPASASLAEIAAGVSGSGGSGVEVIRNMTLGLGGLVINIGPQARTAFNSYAGNIVTGGSLAVTNISSSAQVIASNNVTTQPQTYTNAGARDLGIHRQVGQMSNNYGAMVLIASASAINATANISTAAMTVTNRMYSGSVIGSGSLIFNNNINAGGNNTYTITGSFGGTGFLGMSNNATIGAFNTIFTNVEGRGNHVGYISNVVGGQHLILTGSNNNAITASGGGYFGRFNADDGIRNQTAENIFFVGTGTSTSNRKTGFLIDSGSNSYFEGTLNVSGSTALTGSLLVSSFTTLASVSSSLDFADDTAAAAGGVPLGGLYRNGNFVMIRLT